MPANMMSAPVGSSFTVSGSSIATVSAGPTPGSTPTSVPQVTPIRPHIRFIGCSATPNPEASAFSVSIVAFSLYARAAQDRREPSRRQVDVQRLDEKKKDREREHRADREIARNAPAAETARDTGKEHDRSDHEPSRADQRHLGEEPGRDPAEGRAAESMLTPLARVVGQGAAPAARERLEGKPDAERDEPGGNHARDEVRADAGIAGFARERRGHRGCANAEGEHAQRQRDLGAGAAHYFYLFRPSDSMIDATRLVSSSRNFL